MASSWISSILKSLFLKKGHTLLGVVSSKLFNSGNLTCLYFKNNFLTENNNLRYCLCNKELFICVFEEINYSCFINLNFTFCSLIRNFYISQIYISMLHQDIKNSLFGSHFAPLFLYIYLFFFIK